MTTIQNKLPLHRGYAPTTQVFTVFATPRNEIGKLVSYSSNLPTNYRRGIFRSVFSAAGLAVPALFFVFGLLSLVFHMQIVFAVTLSVALSACIFWYVWHYGAAPHFCTFVGKDGVAKFSCRNGDIGKIIRRKIHRFEDADSLSKRIVRHSVNGVYTGTVYDFSWCDKNGKKIFGLIAEAKDYASASIDSEVPFLLAAERQWNEHLAARKSSEMNENGYMPSPDSGSYQKCG